MKIDIQKLEKIIQSQWVDFFDKNQLMQVVLTDTHKASFRTEIASIPLRRCVSITITKVVYLCKGEFEIWVEFSVPKGKDILIGSHIYIFTLDGKISLQSTTGVCFQQKSDNL